MANGSDKQTKGVEKSSFSSIIHATMFFVSVNSLELPFYFIAVPPVKNTLIAANKQLAGIVDDKRAQVDKQQSVQLTHHAAAGGDGLGKALAGAQGECQKKSTEPYSEALKRKAGSNEFSKWDVLYSSIMS
ncbi:hypothetical protein F53441_5415 [Fusarium austroafricanum]|uniref:Uncharacterized protein n=1 Tax=Fusarium austroafricanum TaxID=2364996 RepID=A0A8H4KL05_9HYPO|nr:hypothetical protein F53441_5415 [Fusarium austroafricanum]